MKFQYIVSTTLLCMVSILLSFTNAIAKTYQGNIVLETQQEVEEFGRVYTSMTGNLMIVGQNIDNLSTLNNLKSIGGDLRIEENDRLVSLDSFNQLKEVGGGILIESNNALINIKGFVSLQKINGFLAISYCNRLIEITGLQRLEHIQTQLSIAYNPALKSISGLSQLKHVGESINICNNNILPHIDELQNVRSTSDMGIRIYDNDALTQIDGLQSITQLSKNLKIEENDRLQNLNGISQIKTIGEAIYIKNNRSLNDITGLFGIKNVGIKLSITKNSDLTDCCLLTQFPKKIQHKLVIENNAVGCNSFPEVIALCQDVVVEDLVVKKKDNNKQASTKPSSKEKNTANNKANVAKNSSTFIQASDNESSAIPAISVSQANINRSESDISNNNEEDIPDLLSFDGEVLFQGNLLQWYTPREQDNDFFNIFHSIDGRQFELIRSIPSRGNANNVTPYDMVHRMASKGTNYYYITQTHKDGDVSKVSNTMNVSRVDDDMTLLNIASNKGNLHVVYIIPQTGDANLNIYDEAGKLLKEDVLKATKEDYNRARLDISGLATGTYYLQLAQQGQDISTKFFIR